MSTNKRIELTNLQLKLRRELNHTLTKVTGVIVIIFLGLFLLIFILKGGGIQ